MSAPAEPAEVEAITRRHLAWGWTMLLVFVLLGVVLEALHAFKSGWYLDVGHDTRRLMWRLGHAHGTLLSLVHLAFALTLPHLARSPARRLAVASAALRAGSVLLPAGFVLGGVWIHGGDPGLGVLLVPLGAVALVLGAATVAIEARRR
ncbi:MAG: hypothetical protein H6701_08720 [Myxococcales bacterium]|nr:hypothetical protein [Myxococcales bacterium]